MKRILAVICTMGMLLTGCGKEHSLEKDMLGEREKLLSSAGCRFDAVVTADYGDWFCEFSLGCSADSVGNMTFEVKAPESIAGIRGKICAERGELVFEDQVLAFDLLPDQNLSPVSAPWVLLKAMRSGYLSAISQKDGMRICTLDDSYREEQLQLDLWTVPGSGPVRGELFWKGRRCVTVVIENFRLL